MDKTSNFNKLTKGRFVSLVIGNSKKKTQKVSAKIYKITPQYVTYFDSGSRDIKTVKKSSIIGAPSGVFKALQAKL